MADRVPTTDLDLDRCSNAELLALLIDGRAAGPSPEGVYAATTLLEEAGGLDRLARADPFELLQGIDLLRASRRAGAARAMAAAFELGRRVARERARAAPRVACAEDVATWAMPRLGDLAHEELWILALDGRSRLRAARQVAKGGLHGAAARIADPIRAALRVDASAFVLVHNHPSGDPTPSKEDVAFTLAVANASDVVGVPLVDHVVVASGTFASVPWLAANARADAGERASVTPPRHSGAMAHDSAR